MPVRTISEVIAGDSAAILRAVRKKECHLAIWERKRPFPAKELIEDRPENIRLTTSLGEFLPDFCKALRQAGYGPSHAREALISDAADLAEHFAAIARTKLLSLRLAVVDTDSCRKFHADWVTARLITTYAGPGTEWIDHEDAARVADGHEPLTIHRLQPGDVGIFKGRLATERPAIHRSPPIVGTGAQRLLLVLDPTDDEQGTQQ